MKTLKLKTLGSCLAATVMSGALAFSAFAADISFDWFQENATTAAAALDNAGATDWGTWACKDGLSTVMSAVGEDVVLDVDEEAPLSFTMKAASSADKSPIISGTFSFGRAYDKNALPAVTGAKIGLCLANDEGTLKLAYIAGEGDIGWAVSDYEVDIATDFVEVSISVSGTAVTYEVGGEVIGVGEITKGTSLSSAEFVGAGSFQAFDGEYTAEKAAKIGDTYYDTLELAAAAVQNGDVVTVLDDEKTWPAPGKRIGYTFGAGTVEEPGYIPALDATALNEVGLKGSIKDGAFTAAPNFESGDGLDEDTPFEIASKDDLLTLKALVDNGTLAADEIWFKQTAEEIDLTGEVWTGIGSYEGKAFVGTYDGDGNKVSGLSLASELNSSDLKYNGLFGKIQGTVKNLTVAVTGFANDDTSTKKHGGAAVVGLALQGSEIVNCTAEGTLTIANATYAHNVAGIVTRAESGVSIVGCVNKVDISSCYSKMAGIVAIVQNDGAVENLASSIENCTNQGNITATAGGSDGVAGIVGYNGATGVSITGCENKGTLTGVTGSSVGQILGKRYTTLGTISGNKVDLTKGLALGSGTESGLNFADSTGALVADATVLPADDGVAYTVMSKTPALTDVAIAADQSITFSLNGTAFAPTFAQPSGYKVEPSGTDPITYTCVADKTEVSVEELPDNVEELVIKQDGVVVDPEEEGGLVWKLDPSKKYTITFVAVDGYYAEPETTAEMDVEYKTWEKSELAALTEIKPYEAEVAGDYYKTIAEAVAAAKGAEITVLVEATWNDLTIAEASTLTVVDDNITIAGGTTLADDYIITAGKFLAITEGGSFDADGNMITLGEGSKFYCDDENLKDADPAVFTNDNVKDPEFIDDAQSPFNGCFMYELESAAPGPAPVDDGTVTKDDDGTWVVTPAAGKTSISVKGAAGYDFKVTDPRDFTITFDEAPESVVVMNNDVDISALVKGMAEGGNTFSTELDPAKATPAVDTTAETPFVVGDTVALAVAAKAGLFYRLVRAADLGFAEPATAHVASPEVDGTIQMVDTAPNAATPFYKVIASKE